MRRAAAGCVLLLGCVLFLHTARAFEGDWCGTGRAPALDETVRERFFALVSGHPEYASVSAAYEAERALFEARFDSRSQALVRRALDRETDDFVIRFSRLGEQGDNDDLPRQFIDAREKSIRYMRMVREFSPDGPVLYALLSCLGRAQECLPQSPCSQWINTYVVRRVEGGFLGFADTGPVAVPFFVDAADWRCGVAALSDDAGRIALRPAVCPPVRDFFPSYGSVRMTLTDAGDAEKSRPSRPEGLSVRGDGTLLLPHGFAGVVVTPRPDGEDIALRVRLMPLGGAGQGSTPVGEVMFDLLYDAAHGLYVPGPALPDPDRPPPPSS